jgi:hypothetical protein
MHALDPGRTVDVNHGRNGLDDAVIDRHPEVIVHLRDQNAGTGINRAKNAIWLFCPAKPRKNGWIIAIIGEIPAST